MATNATAVTIKLKANGKDFLNPGVMSLSITHQANFISCAELELFDGDAAKQDFELSSSGDFNPGTELEIELGHNPETQSVFKGIIVRHQIKSRRFGSTSLCLEVKHEAVKMTHIRKTRHFIDQTDADIAETLIKDHGLSANVNGMALDHERMVQYNVSDWDFLVMRAEANGCVVHTTPEGIEVKAPEVQGGEDKPKATFGFNIYEFEAEQEGRDQFTGGQAIAWDHSSQELLENAAESSVQAAGKPSAQDLADSLDSTEFGLRHSGDLPDAELKAWSDAMLMRSRLSKMRGRVQLEGDQELVPGVTLMLEGLSKAFNGPAYISAVRHSVSEGIWLSDVELGLPIDCFASQVSVAETPISGLLAPMPGLQIGVVKQVTEDPAGFFRALVKMPVIDDAEDGIWCRVAHTDAGASHGVFFQPSVGDEVVLGFLNDDPRHAIILGGLHNNDANKPPFEDNDEYTKSGIVTKEGIKITFNDEDKSIIIETPSGKMITLDDNEGVIRLEDDNRNKIEMSQDGIIIESGKDLILKATGDVSLEGINVEQTAQAQFTAKGTAGLEVSSSAVAVLKGSLVQIN